MTLVLEESLVFEEISVEGYEKVYKVTDDKVGLKAIICIHDTTLGPALGGTRIYPYASFDAALNDVMRLSKGMTYKSALTQSAWGGGKSVIIADPKKGIKPELLRSFGNAVNRLKGIYICAEDLGCTPEHVLTISKSTPFVVGLPHEKSSGDPSFFTAWGTYRGIQSVLKKICGSDSVQDKTIAVQGLGAVGSRLADILFWHGAKLIICDVDSAKAQKLAKQYSAQLVSPEEIYSVQCDVFSPCALGGILNSQNIPKLRCLAVAGSANNQLLKDSDADELKKRSILYAPDFVINAGGLINVTEETEKEGYQPIKARNKVHNIYDQLMVIYDIAEQNRCSTHQAAISLGSYRLKYAIGKRQTTIYFHHSNFSL